MRLMAFDYGTKRVGIAVTDPLQIIATGLQTVHAKDVVQFVKDYLKTEAVECFVVGDPRNMDNTPSESKKFVDQFVKQLKNNFPEISVELIDERFTSKIAVQSMIESGMKKSDRRKKENVDLISAVLILQSFLESKQNKSF